VIVDHPFRLGKLISYHGRNLPGFERIIYFRQGHPLTDQANWLMLHHFDGQPGLPRQVFLTRHKGTFVRVARYPYGGLSGIVIDVYRRVAGP
jgi:hypothetical protein